MAIDKPEIMFVDMDGVIADFVGGACRAHGRPNPYLDPANYGVWDMDKIWGMTANQFWKPCEGPTFWDDLEKTPDADYIVESVAQTCGWDNVAVLTAPSMSPYCVPGKRRWMKRHYPRLADQMIFAKDKHFLAGPGRGLIDDKDSNVEEFNKAGGQGYLLARPWNSRWRDLYSIAIVGTK